MKNKSVFLTFILFIAVAFFTTVSVFATEPVRSTTRIQELNAELEVTISRGNLYYTIDCKDCKSMMLELNRSGLRKAVKLIVRDIKKYTALYNNDLEKCKIDSTKVEEPFLAIEGQCFFGVDVVRKELQNRLDNFIEVQGATSNLPIVSSGVAKETAKKNTLIFIGGMTLGLILLIVLGYALDGRKREIVKLKKGTRGVKTIVAVGISMALATILVGRLFLIQSQAFCPVCTVAVGAGLVFAKEMGIDDVISSIWIGGLLLSMSLWLVNWLKSKKIKFRFMKPVILLVMYGLVIVPFISSNTIGPSFNRLWGIDKVLFGMAFGALGFGGGMILSDLILKKNNGKVYFPFQKVVIPIIMMIILSLIFYFIVY